MPRPPSHASRRLWTQLLLYLGLIGFLPLTITSYLNYTYTARAVKKTAISNLTSMAKRQSNAIAEYIARVHDVTGLLSKTTLVAEALEKAKSGKIDQETPPKAEALEILNTFGISNLFLLNPEGEVLRGISIQGTASKDKNKQIDAAYAEALPVIKEYKTTFPVFIDQGSPSFLLVSPIFDKEILKGILITQVNKSKIFKLLNNFKGPGESGETVIAIERAGQLIFIQPDETTQENTPIATHGASLESAILAGKKGGGTTDENGQQILAAWTFAPNQNWGVIVQIDKSEVLGFVNDLRRIIEIIVAITLLVVFLAALLLSRSITRPLQALSLAAKDIALGDLSTAIPIQSKNEIGLLGHAFRDMKYQLRNLVAKIQMSIKSIALSSKEIAKAISYQTITARQTESSSKEITLAAQKIAGTARELTRTMEEVNHVAQGTARIAESGLEGLKNIESTMNGLQQSTGSISDQLSGIREKADAIGSIVTTMTQVTDQANLLSLNASIQARKAGIHGKGFNIVAQEIRRLADQTAVFTLDIENTVQDMLESVQTGVHGMGSFSLNVQTSVENITAISGQLSNTILKIQGLPTRLEEVFQGMQDQSREAGQIKHAMLQLSQSTQETAGSLMQTGQALEALINTATTLESEIMDFKTSK
mgnify:CR=1 FL=1